MPCASQLLCAFARIIVGYLSTFTWINLDPGFSEAKLNMAALNKPSLNTKFELSASPLCHYTLYHRNYHTIAWVFLAFISYYCKNSLRERPFLSYSP